MNSDYSADVIVVGGGTAGSPFAWRSRLGHRVIVFEKRDLGELGEAIEIFHMERSASKNSISLTPRRQN